LSGHDELLLKKLPIDSSANTIADGSEVKQGSLRKGSGELEFLFSAAGALTGGFLASRMTGATATGSRRRNTQTEQFSRGPFTPGQAACDAYLGK
jgi:hypothetical protein